jgi:hypothetical protein
MKAYSDRMLNLVELMGAFGSTGNAFKPGCVTLASLSTDLLGLVRCIARVNGTTVTIEVPDTCRDSEACSPGVRLILLVTLETLVRSNINANKALKVEINCSPKPAAGTAIPVLPETWLNAQLHQAVQELREDVGGEIELQTSDHGTTARIAVPVKADVSCR